MKKGTIIIILIILLIISSFLFILFPETRDGICYPHDNIIKLLKSAFLALPPLTIVGCLIVTIVSEDINKIIKKMVIMLIIFAIIIPIILGFISNNISNYDRNHHEGESCSPWKALDKK